MSVFLVGYDLRHKHITEYKELFAAIEHISNGDWWHCLDSTWLIVHPGSADTIWRALIPHLHNTGDRTIGDKLLVSQVVKDTQWSKSFPETCHQWLLKNLN
jgi:hypothetical protein